MPRDLLALNDLDWSDIEAIAARARDYAGYWAERRMPQALAGKRIALVVNDDGWRNTTAFDLGIQAMGGISAAAPMRLDRREEIGDLAAFLDNWVDAVVARTPELATLRALAAAMGAPVINARTRANHPCETLGDLAYHQSRHGTIRGLKVAVVAPDANILGSWIEAAESGEIEVVQIYPAKWRASAPGNRGFRASDDMGELRGANIVVTDCWPQDGDEDVLSPFQVTAERLDALDPNAEFLPCPPVHRGREVSADAMRHPTCRVIEAKAFLLHAQNAALERLLDGA